MLRLMHTFEGQTIPPDVLAAVHDGQIGAFCLFGGKNIASPAHLRDLSEMLMAAAHEGGQPPPLIGIDQEGGQLMAVTGGTTELPGNMALGATRSPALAREAGRVLARELLAMGANLNFAPCFDVNVNPANPVVGTRSFGDDPALVVLTDAMDMAAVASEGALPSVRAALMAGVDLVVLAHLPDQMALAAAVADLRDPVSEARIMRARQAAPRSMPSLSLLGSVEHRAIVQEIADQSITLVRDGGLLPLAYSLDESIVVITPEPANLTPADTSADVEIALASAVRKRQPKTTALKLPRRATGAQLRAVLEASRGADFIVVGTISAGEDPGQVALVRALLARGDRPVVISLRTPYDLVEFPDVETYLCTYSIRPASMEAAARVLFGEIPARGMLPCAIPGIAASGTGQVMV